MSIQDFWGMVLATCVIAVVCFMGIAHGLQAFGVIPTPVVHYQYLSETK